MAFLVASVTLGGHARLLRENILEELSNALKLAPTASLIPRAVCLLILHSYILQVVLHDLDVFWWLANLDEGPNENRVVIKLHNIV